jgi:hypothetical protein
VTSVARLLLLLLLLNLLRYLKIIVWREGHIIIDLRNRSWCMVIISSWDSDDFLYSSNLLIFLCQNTLYSSHFSLKFHIKVSFSSFFYYRGIQKNLLSMITINSYWLTMSYQSSRCTNYIIAIFVFYGSIVTIIWYWSSLEIKYQWSSVLIIIGCSQRLKCG